MEWKERSGYVIWAAEMFSWLKKAFASKPKPEPRAEAASPLPEARPEALSAGVESLLKAPDWGQRQLRELFKLINQSSALEPAVAGSFFEQLSVGLSAWFEAHPFEMTALPNGGFRVVDPLGFRSEELLSAGEPAIWQPWARSVRSVELTQGDAHFPNGWFLADLLELFAQPGLPSRIELLSLRVPLDYHQGAEIGALVQQLVANPSFASLRHLGLAGMHLEPKHLLQLAEAPWASSLESLDLSERTIDWCADHGEAVHRSVIKSLGKFSGLTHLDLYNNLCDAGDVAAFLEAPHPKLKHLNIGGCSAEPEFLELWAKTGALPSLEALYLNGGATQEAASWELLAGAPFKTFLHGRQVDSDYPRR